MEKDRVGNAMLQYRRSFLEEIQLIERYKPNGYEAFRFHRHFARSILWPPLHNRSEIDRFMHQLRNSSVSRKK